MGECPKAVKSLSTYVNFGEKIDKYKLWVHLLLQVALLFWVIMNMNFKERYHNSQYMQLKGEAILMSSCYFHEIVIFCFTNYQDPKEIEDRETSNQTSQQRTRNLNRYKKASQNVNRHCSSPPSLMVAWDLSSELLFSCIFTKKLTELEQHLEFSVSGKQLFEK